jgi:Fic family protein
MGFNPVFVITPLIAQCLMQIEVVRQTIKYLPISPIVLHELQESARLESVHYSTKIEANRLSLDEVRAVVLKGEHFLFRERDAIEVRSCYAALVWSEQYAAKGYAHIPERAVQELAAMVMEEGKKTVKPAAYRDGQNVIREGFSGRIVYLPPLAEDVSVLMRDLIVWINTISPLPCPLVAAIAHYQFATIHPYYDGNGRTARLLTSLILKRGDYDLQGINSLEGYYAQELHEYYSAIGVGPSYNYYEGRAEADITQWVEYFIQGMAVSFEKTLLRVQAALLQDGASESQWLDLKKCKILELFKKIELVSGKDIGEFLGLHERTARNLCQRWVREGFLIVVDPSKRGRKYRLADQYVQLLENKP